MSVGVRSGGAGGAGWWLAIDFGTSNTGAAAVAQGSAAQPVALSHTGNLMSSAVFAAEDGSIDVGEVAVNRSAGGGGTFVPHPNRYVGAPAVSVGAGQIPVSQVVAAVYHAVIGAAARMFGGAAPAGLLLTHPEGWSPAQIDTLVSAAESLGFARAVIRTVSEPRAAVAHYARIDPPAPGSDVAVFDFGGGTVDVAVLRIGADGQAEVVAARGDDGLGGRNFDGLLRRWGDEQLAESDPDLLDHLRGDAPLYALRTLDEGVRRAKELLSSTPSATIPVIDSRTGTQTVLTVTRTELEELLDPEVERAVALARATLADAGHTDGSGLAALYLTGGSTRMPLIHRRLGELGPVATLDDPKLVVPLGALVTTDGAGPRPVVPAQPAPPSTGAQTAPSVQADGETVRSSTPAGSGPAAGGGAGEPSADPEAAVPARRRSRTRVTILAASIAAVLIAGTVGAVWALGGSQDTNEPPAADVDSVDMEPVFSTTGETSTSTSMAAEESADKEEPTLPRGVGAPGKLVVWGDEDADVDSFPIELAAADVIQVDAGQYRAIALTADGDVVTWGEDFLDTLEDNSAQWADDKIIQVAAGDYHFLALGESGKVYGWGGDSENGQMEVLDPVDGLTATGVFAGGDLSAVVTDDGKAYTGGSFLQAPEPGPPSQAMTGRSVVKIVADRAAAILLTDTGEVWTWGEAPDASQIPPRISSENIVDVGTGRGGFYALSSEGTMFVWDDEYDFSYRQFSGKDKPVSFAVGTDHVLGLTEDGRVVVLEEGKNEYGQGDVPPELVGRIVTSLSAGPTYNLAVVED